MSSRRPSLVRSCPYSVRPAAGRRSSPHAAPPQLAAVGLRVVFVADQRYLHSSLLEQPALRHPNIVVGTPDEVVRKLCPDLPPVGPDYLLWEAFMEVTEAGEAQVDAVIVDEAQSYDKDLLEALIGLCPTSCQMYADPYQRDSTGMWRPPGQPRTFWLTRNCRNAMPIAKLVARLSGSLAPREGAPGSSVRFIEAERDRAAFRVQFTTAVDDLVSALSPAQVAHPHLFAGYLRAQETAGHAADTSRSPTGRRRCHAASRAGVPGLRSSGRTARCRS